MMNKEKGWEGVLRIVISLQINFSSKRCLSPFFITKVSLGSVSVSLRKLDPKTSRTEKSHLVKKFPKWYVRSPIVTDL